MMTYLNFTSADLRNARKKAGYNQTELAELSGCARGAVSYWENQNGQLRDSPALNAMFDVLNLGHLKCYFPNIARARGWGITDTKQIMRKETSFEIGLLRLQATSAWRASRLRVRCLAKTRKGHPCKNKSEAGRRRCKFHGGMSTGPRTKAGRSRIAEAQRLRWQRYREAKLLSKPSNTTTETRRV